MSDLRDIIRTLDQYEQKRRVTKLDRYEPYGYQLRFHNATGLETTAPAKQRFLMAANGTGKTMCAANESAYHLTGRYPAWWKGTVFRHPT